MRGDSLVRHQGIVEYLDEDQQFLLFTVPDDLPDTFDHTVTGNGVDRGFRYAFRWAPVGESLRELPVRGAPHSSRI